MTDFREHQRAFIEAVRKPDSPLPVGVAPERMAVYRELMFNNIQNFVNHAFPVLRGLYPPALWQQHLQQFFQHARCESPYFLHIAESFLTWFATQPQALPFALELAHYEWAELYVATLPSAPLVASDCQGFLRLSPCALVLSYQFPVHQIRADFQPTTPDAQGCFLLVYRNIEDQVRFMALNQLTCALLTFLEERPLLTFTALTEQFAELIPQLPRELWLSQAEQLCLDLAQKGVIQTSQTPEK